MFTHGERRQSIPGYVDSWGWLPLMLYIRPAHLESSRLKSTKGVKNYEFSKAEASYRGPLASKLGGSTRPEVLG
ncbi:MAG: hypothetical protein KGI84_09090, partial [Elusimicrobia bacterium]|nr:hypothetical protein [Elusimicrobiota bacterium]